jgi:hypothetical protein
MSNPAFPVYIPSKGRASKCITMRALDEMGVPYRVVVEEFERAAYTAALGASRVLVLDPEYQRRYDTFDTLGMTKSVGPGAARNFIWDHAISQGAAWHWVLDDNIHNFEQRTKRGRINVLDGTIFALMETFALRYTNVGMAGPTYRMFCPDATKRPPFTLNTRIYSCNLIRNDVPLRWRGRYNEDTDLSLRMLKSGWCTVLFNGFLQDKLATQTVGGGNTADFYSREGTGPKSKMLYAMHPDVVKVVKRYGRVHHHIDYAGEFSRLRLLRRDDLPAPTGVAPQLDVVKIDKRVQGRQPREFWQAAGIVK